MWGGDGWAQADFPSEWNCYTRPYSERVSINPRSVGLVVGKRNETLRALKKRPGIEDVVVQSGGHITEIPFEGQGSSWCTVTVTGWSEQAVRDVVEEVRKYESRHKWGQMGGTGVRSLHVDIGKGGLRMQEAAVGIVAADFKAYKQERSFYTISRCDGSSSRANPGQRGKRNDSSIHVGPNLPGLPCLLHELETALSDLPTGDSWVFF